MKKHAINNLKTPQKKNRKILSVKAAIAAGFIVLAGISVIFLYQEKSAPPATLVIASATPAAKPSLKVASLDPALSDKDAVLYNAAISAQKKADWNEADKQLSAVENTALISSLMADRFLHAKYTSRFEELKEWLIKNPDHPNALSIRNLVRSKYSKEAKSLPDIQSSNFSPRAIDDGKASILRVIDFTFDDVNPLAQRAVNKVLVTLETQSPDEALSIIRSAHTSHIINDRTRAILIGRVANHYFKRGNYAQAYQLSINAVSAYSKPFAAHQWMAAISAVHVKQPLTAARQFSKIAKRDDLPVADIAAASFWAANMYKKTNSSQANVLLEIAAKYDRTFYGILAQKALGKSLNIAKTPALDEDSLSEIPGIERAASWIALGKNNAAQEELIRVFSMSSDIHVKQQVIALASKWNMPVLQMKMGSIIRAEKGERLDYALYPTPGWKPNAGYQVDPALLYAIARQESKFDRDARSPAGAMGIMQLMPTTAHYVAKSALGNADSRNVRNRLNEPVTSIALGQEYLQYLMQKPYINNNLMFVAAAYNAGPGKLSEWKERMGKQDNPLLFLESISFTETRNYVHQVFVNYWVYSELMGEESPTLEALASNNWPLYEATNLEFAGLFEGGVN